MKKVFVCQDFDNTALLKFKAKKCTTLVALNCFVKTEELAKIEIIPILEYNSAGGWRAYHRICLELDVLFKKNPFLFKIRQYDLTNAYKKMLLWEYYIEGMLNEAVDKLKQKEKIQIELYNPRLKRKKFKAVLWLLKNKFLNFSQPIKNKKNRQQFSGKYIFCVKVEAVQQFLQRFINQFDENQREIYYYGGVQPKDKTIITQDTSVNIFKVSFKLVFNWQNVLSLRLIVEYYCRFYYFIRDIEDRITETNKAFIVNAMENSWEGHLIGEIAHKNKISKIKVFNTMHGAKGNTANNADVNFDYWFVWSQKMRENLISNKVVPSEILVNVDLHLIEDDIANHTFSESIKFNNIDNVKDYFVISIMLPRDATLESINVITAIFSDFNLKTLFLLRAHPRSSDVNLFEEKIPKEYRRQVQIIDSIQAKNDTAKKILYDQLLISDLSIVFGSTTAYESKWFGVPCISYEEQQASAIIDADNETIIHVKNLKELKIAVSRLQQVKKVQKEIRNKQVAKVYANFIKEKILD